MLCRIQRNKNWFEKRQNFTPPYINMTRKKGQNYNWFISDDSSYCKGIDVDSTFLVVVLVLVKWLSPIDTRSVVTFVRKRVYEGVLTTSSSLIKRVKLQHL